MSVTKLKQILARTGKIQTREESFACFKLLYSVVDLDELITDPRTIFKLHEPFIDRVDLAGTGIRFTVQTNLFCGSVIQFGTDEHRNTIRDKSVIGAFALTERKAGISSGLFLGTTCTYETKSDTYLLNTGDIENRKIWISNGLYATHAVVFALLKGKIQPFFVQLRNERGLKPGIVVKDMGEKHTFAELDNVSIEFRNLRLPASAIMNRKEIKNFYSVADRLLTGRCIAAWTALKGAKHTMDAFYQSICKKEIQLHSGHIPVCSLPHIREMFEAFERNYQEGKLLVDKNIELLCKCIETESHPSKKLVESINCAKIFCTEAPRDTMFQIQVYFGSQSLLFPGCNPSLYIPNIIAEGDTGILRQKIAGDCLKQLIKNPFVYVKEVWKGQRGLYELSCVVCLFFRMMVTQWRTGLSKERAWLENYTSVVKMANVRSDYVRLYC